MAFLTFGVVGSGGKDRHSNQLAYWKLRRPIAWHGFLWLWEFWFALAMGVSVFWSLVRDFKSR